MATNRSGWADPCRGQEAPRGALAAPGDGPGAAFRRPSAGYRYFLILLDVDTRSVQLALVQHLVLLEHRHDILRGEFRQRIDRVLQIQQPALAGFLLPFLRVVVPVEDDPLVRLDLGGGQLAERVLERDALFELGFQLAARYGAHGGAERDQETGIRVLEEALTFPGLPASQRGMSRLALGQLYFAQVLAYLQSGALSTHARSGDSAPAEVLAAADELGPPSRRPLHLRAAGGAVHGFVAEHDWVPSVLDQTPWERAAGREPGRTRALLASVGRVDPRDAHATLLAEPAAGNHPEAQDPGTVTECIEGGRVFRRRR